MLFLDVEITLINDKIKTSVYTKPTNNGELLNYISECPTRYKSGVIKTMINRSYKISSNLHEFNLEIERLKQVFINNNYPIQFIDKCITKFKTNKNFINENTIENNENKPINIFYKNQMNSQYEKDEKIMKDIIKQNVKTTNNNEYLNLIIYYNNTKSKDLIMKNNLNFKNDTMSKSWTVYKVKCPFGDCELPNPCYIGQTRNNIKTRLRSHAQNGAIKTHLFENHNITRFKLEDIETHTESIKILKDLNRLNIYEALLILQDRPDMNRQIDNFYNPLKLYARNYTNSLSQQNQTQIRSQPSSNRNINHINSNTRYILRSANNNS